MADSQPLHDYEHTIPTPRTIHTSPRAVQALRSAGRVVLFADPRRQARLDGDVLRRRCLSRGCSCEVDRDIGLPYRDKCGGLLPCCEFSYDPDGFWLNRHGRMYWPAAAHAGRFIARLPLRGSMVRWPPAWHRGGRRVWAALEDA